MPWPQNYAPLGGVGTSALIASLPVALLLALLAFWHVRAWVAALAALACAAAVAIGVFHFPLKLAVAAAGYGAAFGLFPISWIVVHALFIYTISVETGGFAVLQNQVSGLSADRRIQALLIAFSFGAFIEGAAGFGAPIATTGALLIGLGFAPLEAAKLALIGNTAPVAFGSLGIPLVTLASVTGLDLGALSAMVGRQLPPFSLLVPFWLIAAHAGWRGMLAVWPACLVCGGTFAVVQFLVSNFHGPWLVDLASSLASMLALVVLLRFWQPRDAASASANVSNKSIQIAAPWRAWLPWVLLSVVVFAWGLPEVKNFLNGLGAPKFPVPSLHRGVLRVAPIVAQPTPEDAVFTLNLFSAAGTALLLAGIAAGLSLGLGPGKLLRLYGRTWWRARVSVLTIALMVALGYTTRYSGTDTTMGLAFAATGLLFPFFSPLLGWLGVALTGSDTSSNILFGNLQQVTARALGLPPVLTAAANSSGGVMGKMIDAQSIVVAGAATGSSASGTDAGSILRAVFWHSLALAILMGMLVWAQAALFPGVVPSR